MNIDSIHPQLIFSPRTLIPQCHPSLSAILTVLLLLWQLILFLFPPFFATFFGCHTVASECIYTLPRWMYIKEKCISLIVHLLVFAGIPFWTPGCRWKLLKSRLSPDNHSPGVPPDLWTARSIRLAARAWYWDPTANKFHWLWNRFAALLLIF